MEPVVTTCVGCGKAIRIRRPEIDRRRACPFCQTVLGETTEGLTPKSPVTESAAPPQPSRDRRPLMSAPGLLRMTLILLSSAHLAIWSVAFFTTTETSAFGHTVDASPRLVKPDRMHAMTDVLSAWGKPLGHALRSANVDLPLAVQVTKIAALKSTSLPIVFSVLQNHGEGISSRLAQTKFAVRLASFVQADSSTGQERVAAPVTPMNSEIAPVLTPPDFGVPSSEVLTAQCPAQGDRRFLIRNEDGRQVVARLHGHHEDKTVLMLPDGRLGIPSMLVPTDEPFVAMKADEMEQGLQSGPFAEFAIHRTPHYLILHQATPDFAETNGRLLEDLYKRLIEAFRKHDVTVHEAEFPLVAVIFRTEQDFRAHRAVAPDVQAYYEIFSNRIVFYQTSDREGIEPEVSALLKPQMVAHEGTHQILQNIGVQPRLSAWPLWLVEGLAEYCASPASSRKGPPTWDGLGQINNLHMATLRELEDPLSLSMRGQDARTKSLFRRPGQPLVEAMLRRSELTPTEYALAWAITHYLALKRGDDFTRFLRRMAEEPPLEPRTPDDHVRHFREAFGNDLARLDKTIDAYLRKLTKQKGYDPMPYYAVMFEQPLPTGLVRRAAMVSQSPQVIQQWIHELSNPNAGIVSWQALPHPSHARATLVIQDWMSNY